MTTRIASLVAATVLLAVAASAEPPLVASKSFYARANSGSQVRWHPWDEASLAKAREAGKPVYVLVGSEISELTRSTTREIFTRKETADWMNENFFCVFVDADTQPEVAAYAQHFINAARQLKGWPVHLWLTPELKPYEGANYLPPTEEWGRPGFLKSARAALEAWKEDPDRARAMAEEATVMMKSAAPDSGGAGDLATRLEMATNAWLAAADARNGGFGGAPKVPDPELVRFLLTRGSGGEAAAVASARAWTGSALQLPGGGFYRRTIDAEWKQPYPQKLMVDQPRMALALRAVAKAAGDENLRRASDDALRFALKMRFPSGLFAMAADNTDQDLGAKAAGHAPAIAEGLLMSALMGSKDRELQRQGSELAALWAERVGAGDAASLLHDPVGEEAATAADLLGLAIGFRQAGKGELANRLIAAAVEKFFDPATGRFMASPARLPTGIAVRVPALAEPISVEALALLAGVKGEVAAQIRRGLLAQIEYDELPPGAVLLALAATPR